MEPKKNSIFNHALTYGAIVGIALIIWTILLFIMDLSFNKWLGYVSYLFIIAGIILGMKSYRDNVQGGFINYGKALGIGVLISLIAGIISALYFLIHINFVDTEFLAKSQQFTEEQMLSKGLTEEQVEMQIEMTSKFMRPGFMFIMSIVGNVFMGTIISLIIAAFVKKDENPVAV